MSGRSGRRGSSRRSSPALADQVLAVGRLLEGGVERAAPRPSPRRPRAATCSSVRTKKTSACSATDSDEEGRALELEDQLFAEVRLAEGGRRRPREGRGAPSPRAKARRVSRRAPSPGAGGRRPGGRCRVGTGEPRGGARRAGRPGPGRGRGRGAGAGAGAVAGVGREQLVHQRERLGGRPVLLVAPEARTVRGRGDRRLGRGPAGGAGRGSRPISATRACPSRTASPTRSRRSPCPPGRRSSTSVPRWTRTASRAAQPTSSRITSAAGSAPRTTSGFSGPVLPVRDHGRVMRRTIMGVRPARARSPHRLNVGQASKAPQVEVSRPVTSGWRRSRRRSPAG